METVQVISLRTLAHYLNVLVAANKGIQAVKFCSYKILQGDSQ